MTKKEKTSDAVAILHGRFVKDDPDRKASLQEERVNAEVARLIYDLRKDAGLSQEELAELIGTTQSVISRLEDADYDGHSLTMLTRIAEAMRQKLTVVMTAREPEAKELRHAFRTFIQMARKAHGWSVDELSKKTGIDAIEVSAMEQNSGYRPTPLVVHKLSSVFGVPEIRLAALAGAVKEVPSELKQEASRFAAMSDSFAKLTKEERKMLDDFMRFLKTAP
jgi:transcriptional regulator with XRE-family HTH domain